MSTLAVLPVKTFAHAKQRFAEALGIGLRRTEGLDGVIVVTADITAQRLAGGHAVDVVEDHQEIGQSAAAEAGVRRARDRGARRVLLVPGDCPMVDPAEVSRLLGRPRAGTPDALIVPDRHGTGTNALLLTPPDALAPAFGERSLTRHVERARNTGIAHEVVPLDGLALDVDTAEDLATLRERLETTRGGAAHTRGLLSQLARAAVAS